MNTFYRAVVVHAPYCLLLTISFRKGPSGKFFPGQGSTKSKTSVVLYPFFMIIMQCFEARKSLGLPRTRPTNCRVNPKYLCLF